MGATDSKRLQDFPECPEMPESPVESTMDISDMRVTWSEALFFIIGSLYEAIDCAVCWCSSILSIFAKDCKGGLHPQGNVQDLP